MHPDDYAILVVGDYNVNFQTCGRLVSCGVFDKLIYYKINDFPRMEYEDALEEKICQFFNTEFKDINFDNIDKIYTHCDLTNTFEIYLSIKN